MSNRYKTKAERDAFLALYDLETEFSVFEEAGYFEKGRPITLEQWNKLIEDINERLSNPPSLCDAIEEIEEIDEAKVWSIEMVEEVREKLLEMCELKEFDWGWYLNGWSGSAEDMDLLRHPFGREIIFELADQMDWCCGPDDMNLESIYPELGICRFQPVSGYTLDDAVGGMVLGPAGFKGTWQHYYTRHTTAFDAKAEEIKASWAAANPGMDVPWIIGRNWYTGTILRSSGEIGCDGAVIVEPSENYWINDEWKVHYQCSENTCVLATTKPVWWFGPGWEAYNQSVFDDCNEVWQDKQDAWIKKSQDQVDAFVANGEWKEYTLVFRTAIPSDECDPPEGEGSP